MIQISRAEGAIIVVVVAVVLAIGFSAMRPKDPERFSKQILEYAK